MHGSTIIKSKEMSSKLKKSGLLRYIPKMDLWSTEGTSISPPIKQEFPYPKLIVLVDRLEESGDPQVRKYFKSNRLPCNERTTSMKRTIYSMKETYLRYESHKRLCNKTNDITMSILVEEMKNNAKERLASHNSVNHKIGTTKHEIIPSFAIEGNSCPICRRSFSNITRLRVHLLVHKNSMCLKCDECSERFYRAIDLEIHSEKCHKKKPLSKIVLECPHCKKLYRNKGNLDFHIKMHHAPGRVAKTFECDVCKKVYPEKRLLKEHLVYHFKDDWQVEFRCDICRKRFDKKSVLLKHLLIHRPSHNKCPNCSMSLGSYVNLRDHVITQHPDKLFKCIDCHSGFVLKRYLVSHMKTVHFKENYKLQCKKCGKWYETRYKLAQHVCLSNNVRRTKRRGKGCGSTSKCPWCNLGSLVYLDLKKHILSEHPDNHYTCDICGSEFMLKRSISSHVKNHMEEYLKHRCMVCNKAFLFKSGLQNHGCRSYKSMRVLHKI